MDGLHPCSLIQLFVEKVIHLGLRGLTEDERIAVMCSDSLYKHPESYCEREEKVDYHNDVNSTASDGAERK